MNGKIRHETNVIDCVKVEVICVTSRVGSGQDNDPVRHITEYFNMDGRLLARIDNFVPVSE
jgi:hypothetical protein